jgi:predicted amidohydrolase YtcJ
MYAMPAKSCPAAAVLLLLHLPLPAGAADLILHGGKVVAVDERFTVHEALAVEGERILRAGKSADVLVLRGPSTRVVDLEGKMVLPGLIDSHVHPFGAAMTELDHELPAMETVEDVLAYVRSRAQVLEEGSWIQVRQVFITRLREQRYPTREELDRAAPQHPVVFSTGPDASLNSLALELSGIGRGFEVSDGGPGRVEKDAGGEPTGILRSCTRLVKSKSSGREAGAEERLRRLQALLEDYNASGLTSIADRNASGADIERYQALLERGELTARVFISHGVDAQRPIEEVIEAIRRVARHPLRRGGPLLRVGGIKTFLDGGMLTGSAYLREPWGTSRIYSIDDPEYRGMLFIPRERLLPMVRAAVEEGLQFTAHSVGDGAVHLLLDVYEEVARSLPLRATRPCITHSNFMSAEAVAALPRLGVVVDIQPAWLYLDGRTLLSQFGRERLRWFQPLRSIFASGGIAGGGSDHMQKIGSLRSINPYNPFLGMWIAITRTAKDAGAPLHPEEALSREQAIRFYTTNNAYLLFQETETGSLEEGKLADFIVIDRDLLACPLEEIPGTRVLETYLAGRRVHPRPR